MKQKTGEPRTIKSFVCRHRMRPQPKEAFQALWGTYGLDYHPYSNAICEFFNAFPQTVPKVLEIGFGNGDAFVQFIKSHTVAAIGIEVYPVGLVRCMKQLFHAQLQQVKVLHHDGVAVLEHMVPAASLDRFQCFFPDPWHKKRHHKRRLICQSFLECLMQKLASRGIVQIVTDDPSYHAWIESAFLPYIESGQFTALDASNDWIQPRVLSKYEQKASDSGRKIFEHLYQLTKDSLKKGHGTQ